MMLEPQLVDLGVRIFIIKRGLFPSEKQKISHKEQATYFLCISHFSIPKLCMASLKRGESKSILAFLRLLIFYNLGTSLRESPFIYECDIPDVALCLTGDKLNWLSFNPNVVFLLYIFNYLLFQLGS